MSAFGRGDEKGARDMTEDWRYAASLDACGEWVVIDQERNDRTVASCSEAGGAELIAALMNGDLAVLSRADAETLAYCRSAIGGALRPLRPRGRPAVGVGLFPQV